MIFNEHSNLDGSHALFAPSQPSWLNWGMKEDDEAFGLISNRMKSQYSTTIGTLIHEYASRRINYGYKLNRYEKNDILMYLQDNKIPSELVNLDFIFPNLVNYVNDAIGFHLETEKILYFSKYCFGTADAIDFSKNVLRIHDLKTGTTPAHIEQLLVYAAYFCLEYKVEPSNIDVWLRLYQGGDVIENHPDPNDIYEVMGIVKKLDKMAKEIFEKE